MFKQWQPTISVLVVLLFGWGLFYTGTDGFRAFTAETARVLELTKTQPQFPEVTLEDSEGRIYPISDLQGKHVFITFIYTECTTVCLMLEMNMSHVYQAIPSQYFENDIVFLSISFDPTRDDPATLDKYKEYFNSDGETWRMARINDQEELEALLTAFGVIVIPDGKGNFSHNTAFYFVDRKGRLTDVMDYTKVDEAAQTVLNALSQEKGE